VEAIKLDLESNGFYVTSRKDKQQCSVLFIGLDDEAMILKEAQAQEVMKERTKKNPAKYDLKI
jgi:hypothetical protein